MEPKVVMFNCTNIVSAREISVRCDLFLHTYMPIEYHVYNIDIKSIESINIAMVRLHGLTLLLVAWLNPVTALIYYLAYRYALSKVHMHALIRELLTFNTRL